ncbi:MAG TPA: VWA domain-containing protein [Vicinamibacterales bacterium]|nr:VWA domain-containing protein [Vicinamibacterales bacterium]
MNAKIHGFLAAALGAVLVATPSAQAPKTPAPAAPKSAQPATPAPAPQNPTNPTFRVRVDLVTNDIVVRDEKGNFVPDLRPEDIQVYEDGVLQTLSSMTVVTGGRVYNPMAAPVAAAPEGIILPTKRTTNDVSGRIFLFFVDDQHLQFGNTSRVRELFKKIAKELVHDGDLFGIVSSGPSSIQVDMTYDKRQIDEAITKMTGNELKPTEIIQSGSGPGGPSEIRYRAHVAFSTMNEGLKNLEQVHNRRKALVWVSDGDDFAPFKDARYGTMDTNSPFEQNQARMSQRQAGQAAQSDGGQAADPNNDPDVIQARQSEEFADADLSRELYEITQQANRANTTIYTIDPRGLVGPLPDLDENVDPQQWQEFVRKSQDSLRTLAEETGGIAVVNTNDFTKALRKVDADTSDYYVIGYYSTNPDILKRRRSVDIRLKRPGLTVSFRKEYVIRPQRPADAPPAPPVVSSAPRIPTTKQ